MTIKVGINGYGRIGRNVLRALYEGGKRNLLAAAEQMPNVKVDGFQFDCKIFRRADQFGDFIDVDHEQHTNHHSHA